MRWLTLRNVGIAGAVIGLFALVAKPLGIWFEPAPVATIDSPAMHGQVGRCFVARGSLDPKTIWRPLWLIRGEAGKRWREIGRVDTAQTTWAGRICLDGEPGAEHRLALVVADASLDAEFSRLVHPDEETEREIPEWLKPKKCGDQGGCGRPHCCPPLPEGATLVTAVDVTGPGRPYWRFTEGRSSY
jgi:hypothetical protein